MKWFEDKEASEIIKTLRLESDKVVAYLIDGKVKEHEQLYQDFINMYYDVLPVIVDMKTEFWQYRFDNNAYHVWELCLDTIKDIKYNLDKDSGFDV